MIAPVQIEEVLSAYREDVLSLIDCKDDIKKRYLRNQISEKYCSILGFTNNDIDKDILYLQTPVKLDEKKYYTLKELLDNYDPTNNWLVARLLQSTGLYLLAGLPKSGKALSLNTPVLTPNGYKNMGELTLEDKVISEEGLAIDILAIYPQGITEAYRVGFSDGSYVDCCPEHLWTVYSRHGIKKTVSTKWLSSKDLVTKGVKNFKLPAVKPIIFNQNFNFIIDPYLLGVLLGDGHLCGDIVLTNCENDIISKVSELVPEGSRLSYYSKKHHYSFIGLSKKKGDNSVKKELDRLGLRNKICYNKFIPKEYLFSSVDERIRLLQGLIDTDGAVEPNKISYYTTSFQLAQDVIFLVHSLGGLATISQRTSTFLYKGEQRTGKLTYKLIIKVPATITPCSSVKHLRKYNPRQFSINRYITSIEKIEDQETQCITVDSSTGLFVIKDGILTHNSLVTYDLINGMLKSGSFLGFPCKKGKVIFFQTEEGIGTVQRRLSTRGLDDDMSLIEDAINTNQLIVIREFCLKKDLDFLKDLLKEEKPDLVIFDSLRSISSSLEGSENDPSITKYLYILQRIFLLHNTCAIVIHHANKNPQAKGLAKIAGHSGITGSSDGMLIIEQIRKAPNGKDISPSDDDPGQNLIRMECISRNTGQLKLYFKREIEDGGRWSFRLVEEVGLEPEVDRAQKIILRFMVSNYEASWTKKQICEHTGLDSKDDSVNNAFNYLLENVVLEAKKENKKVKRSPFLYSIPKNSPWLQHPEMLGDVTEDMDEVSDELQTLLEVPTIETQLKSLLPKDASDAQSLSNCISSEEILQLTEDWTPDQKRSAFTLLSPNEKTRLLKLLHPIDLNIGDSIVYQGKDTTIIGMNYVKNDWYLDLLDVEEQVLATELIHE